MAKTPRKWISRPLRRRILRRACELCGQRRAQEVDHKIPLWKGGSNAPSNLRGLCRDCHAGVTAEQATERARLRPPKPARPEVKGQREWAEYLAATRR